MVKKSITLKLCKNKSNGQYNISLPKKKLKEFDMKKGKKIKLSIEGFE